MQSDVMVGVSTDCLVVLAFLPELPEIDLPKRTESEKIRRSVVALWKTNHVESLSPNDQIDLKSFVIGRTAYAAYH